MTWQISDREARLWLGVSILLTSFAQILFRTAMLQVAVELKDDVLNMATIASSFDAGSAIALLFGLLCYGISMIGWLIALTRLDVSIAYPMLSVSYVLVYVGAIYLPWLGENPSGIKLIGILTIVAGVAIVASSDRSRNH